MRPFFLCIRAGLATLLLGTALAQAGYVDAVTSETDLFAYWRFDGDTGDNGSIALDQVGAHSGTYKGGAVVTGPGEGAPIGASANRALDLSGIASYIDVGTLDGFAPALGSTGVTIEMWVNSSNAPPGTSSAGSGIPFGLFNNNQSSLFVNLDEDPQNNGAVARDDYIRVYNRGTDGEFAGGYQADSDITDGTWNYLAVSLRPTTNRMAIYTADAGDVATMRLTPIFIDKDTNPASFPEFLTSAFLGAVDLNGSPALPFDGLIDEVAIYTRALGQAELDAHLFASLPAEVVYQEQFPNQTTSNQAISSVGWQAFVGPGAADYTNLSPGEGTRVGVSNLTGYPSSEGVGYGFTVPVGEALDFLALTDEFAPLDLAGYTSLQFSWRQHASVEDVEFRLAVQIGDEWFATDEAFVNTGSGQLGGAGDFPNEGVYRSVLFDLDGSMWRDLGFTPDSLLSLDDAARTLDLPLGPVNAAGLFISSPAGATSRYDDFRITGAVRIPEPGTMTLLGLGGVLMAGAWALRRRAA